MLPARFGSGHGWGMAGICLIRLRGIRPRFIPEAFGVASENAAHRIAVEWDEWGLTRGVFIPRATPPPGLRARRRPNLPRRAPRASGGRAMAAIALKFAPRRQHRHARRCTPRQGLPGRPSSRPDGMLQFFRRGSLGYSVTSDPHRLDGLELRSARWQVEPLDVDKVRSSFFDDRSRFPEGTVAFDSALLMRNIEHEWHGRNPLRIRQAVCV